MNKNIVSVVCFFFLMIAHGSRADYDCFKSRQQPKKTIVILFHLFNLGLMDEFIHRINRCISINSSYTFYVKICIPIGDNITFFAQTENDGGILPAEKENIYTFCKKAAPYHPEMVTHENCLKLYGAFQYLQKKLLIDSKNLQIIFSENRGVDIGSFFLLIDQLIKQKLSHDYIIKIHTKTDQKWRNTLLEILNLDFKKYLPNFDAIYACKFNYNIKVSSDKKIKLALHSIFNYFKLPKKNRFFFPAGTMFMASSKMTNFFVDCDRVALYNQLNIGYPNVHGKIEHAYERFFGYLMRTLKLKIKYLNIFYPKEFYKYS